MSFTASGNVLPMNRITRIATATGLLAALSAAAPLAAEMPDRYYAGVGMHRAALDLSGGGASVTGTDIGYRLIAGYRLRERLSIEASWFGDARVQTASANGSLSALTTAVSHRWPLRRVDVLGRAGVSYWQSRVSPVDAPAIRDSFADPFIGAGIQYGSGNVAVRADFDVLPRRLVNSLDGAGSSGGWADYWSVGVIWRRR